MGQEAPLPAVTIADLLRATLRHRPDRILVGEVRGPEAFDLLQALNTGHQGALSTIHANSAEQALARLAHCVLTANVGLPHHSTREAIALAIHLVVHIDRVGPQLGPSRTSCRWRDTTTRPIDSVWRPCSRPGRRGTGSPHDRPAVARRSPWPVGKRLPIRRDADRCDQRAGEVDSRGRQRYAVAG